MNETQATDLLKRFSSGNCTAAEQRLIEKWYKELVNSGELEYEEGEKESIQEAIEAGILQNIEVGERNYTPYIPFTPVRRKYNRTWWAAAAVLICLSGTVFYLLNKRAQLSVAKTESTLKDDVEPGGNKAVLTLANGKTIVLDDAANGVVARDGNAKVLKPDDGKLVYSSENTNSAEPLSYNTLATPRSGQYQLRLADGTKVWLNAASSIHFPTGFRGKERRVQITGEAYFEVAHDSSMPFIVEKDDLQVEVIGTHFNVNAYSDESVVKTTLLEGKVKVIEKTAKEQQTAILTPGEQAIIPKSNQIQVRRAAVDGVVAWKNGLFHFESADIKTVMRQLARWYDVEVVYEGVAVKNDPLFVEISRNTRLSDVLKVLQESGSAKFSIQGRKIVVK